MSQPPVFTQNALREGFVEFAFGEPDPALLPVGLVREAAARALGAEGAAALAYGSSAGPAALRAAIAQRTAAREGLLLAESDVLVSGGISQAVDQVLTVLAAPGDVVFVECPTYNLALGIIADHPVDVVGVPLDAEGIDVDALAAAVREARASGRRPRLLYTIPTFHNPAGVSLSAPRRKQLLELARREDLLLVEDDVYRELVYEGEAPPALRALDPAAPVIRLGSFSKSLAPGLRLGWIDAPAALRERLAAYGTLESGGCVSQFSAHVVAALLAAGAYTAHVAALRHAYASRRDALAAALRDHLPAGCAFTVPAGGFFLWVTLPPGLAASRLLPVAERHRVAFAPGGRFCADGDDRSLRLAFSLYDEASLAEGARRLGAAVTEAAGGAA
ncbi:MAG TPA: PLP-dependent aminotransferase family protein [Thermoleophilia bacterium]|nr:PLP-dependent aminotransferase family protein [Thermoleophilia bacterium]